MREIAVILPEKAGESFWRTLLTFNITRVLIAFVLFVYLSFNVKKDAWETDQPVYWATCSTYLLLAIVFILSALYYRRHFFSQLLSQIGVDIVVISVLYAVTGGTKSGLAILFLFPLAGGAILAPLVTALFFASIVTMYLLAESGYRWFVLAGDTSFSQAGLTGASFFAVVYAVNRLAARLIKQEELAAQRGRDLQMQEAINRLVIADMGDGILVVGHGGEILTSNPAAEHMLGLSFPDGESEFRMSDIASLLPISEAFTAWIGSQSDPGAPKSEAASFVVVKRGEAVPASVPTIWGGRRELTTHLKLRFVMVDGPRGEQDRTVIFLQDVSEIENQAQQLKLASMGRLTASIAHEVRNPLSAISYAASLLAEDVLSPQQVRLLNIIADNVARMNRMIEDILKLSRKAQPHGEALMLAPLLAEIMGDFHERHVVQEGLVEVDDMDGHKVLFDPVHLREVVVNLLSNALRYASGRRGSIRVAVVRDAVNRLELHVQDDGVAITPEVRAHLFEPFYTTSSKGTGLGLYLARELCLNNGAKLDYEYRKGESDEGGEARGRFVITFAMINSI